MHLRSQDAARAEAPHVRLRTVWPGEHIKRELPVGEPAGLAFWPPTLEHDVPARTVLEVDGGRLIGHYGATITPAGALDCETSPYWGAERWQEHPIFWLPRLPETENVAGTVVSLASHASATNYYHALMDAVARWGVVREAFPDLTPDAIVLGHRNSFGRQIAELVGLDRFRLMEPGRSLAIRADRLLVPSMPDNHSHAPPWITDHLRQVLPAKQVSGRPTRLYITRGTTPNTRRVVQEAAIVEALGRRGFTALDPGSLPVQDQIDHFAAAEVIVAPHGAALVNLNFTSPGVRFLELFAANYMNPAYQSILSNIPDSTYRFLVSDGADPSRTPPQMQALTNDVTLSPARVLAALDALLDA